MAGAIASPGPKNLAWLDYKPYTLKDLKLPGACPTCGAPPGEPGFLRYDAAVGQPHFGQVCPCPDCHGLRQSGPAQPSPLAGRLAGAGFESYRATAGNRAALAAALDFARRPQGWLTLWGGYGLGKTHLLAAVVNHCLAAGQPAIYTTLPDLLDHLRGSYDSSDYSPLFQRLRASRVLAIDEVDKVYLTGWAREKVYQLADARYRQLNDTGTVFGLNIDPAAALAESPTGPLAYLFSRMLDEFSQVVHLAGADARPLAKRLGTPEVQTPG